MERNEQTWHAGREGAHCYGRRARAKCIGKVSLDEPAEPMEADVAKGQMRSNRETRKPKKAKGPAPGTASVVNVFASPKAAKAKKR